MTPSAPLAPRYTSPLQAVVRAAEAKGEDVSDFAFPILETPDPNNPGMVQREWRPFPFKQLKELKEACSKYGPTAPFTITVFETMGADTLPPDDWKTLARACLTPGDYLLWKSEFNENCKKTAHINTQQNIPITFNMLAGEGQYADPLNQIGFELGAYAQTSTAAKRAWRALPVSSR